VLALQAVWSANPRVPSIISGHRIQCIRDPVVFTKVFRCFGIGACCPLGACQDLGLRGDTSVEGRRLEGGGDILMGYEA
jgi:hypothetical protein